MFFCIIKDETGGTEREICRQPMWFLGDIKFIEKFFTKLQYIVRKTITLVYSQW